MSLTSVNYILFLLASVTIYYLLPTRFKSHVIFLVSIAFYIFISPEKLLMLMAYIWIIYFLGYAIHKFEKISYLLFILGTSLSLAVLASLRLLTAIKIGDFAPLGLSYCVLQSIYYLRQIRLGIITPLASPVNLFAYLLFFPKILAGPVEAPDLFLKRLELAKFSSQDINRGLPLIAIGMAKKLAVAEVLTPVATLAFNVTPELSGLSYLIGIISYSFVILFDFSGYSDIALGSALLFGIELTDNFHNPYLSMGIVDFWKRWHISLTSWLRINVYFPLGGSRVKKGERNFNILTVFILSGVWHGASLNFLAWGIYHSLLQIIEIFLREKSGLHNKKRHIPLLFRPFFILLTFAFVTVGWVLFRAPNLTSAYQILTGVFNPWQGFMPALTELNLSLIALICAIVAILITTILKAIVAKYNLSFVTSGIITAVSLLVAIFGLSLMGSNSANSFIYFNF